MRRTAVVTGGNKGIGFEIAKQLLPTVSLLILACRDRERGEAAVRALGGAPKVVFEQLDISDRASIESFAGKMTDVDVLVNNAAIMLSSGNKKEQTGPTMKTNYWGTVHLTEKLLPLLAKSPDGAIVNVASQLGALSQISAQRQSQFSDVTLTKEKLNDLVLDFEKDLVEKGNAWSSSNYGMSKLCVIAYTKILAKEAPETLKVNACCPGYCDTDMTNHAGPRDPADGARNAVMLAQPGISHRGVFIKNERLADW